MEASKAEKSPKLPKQKSKERKVSFFGKIFKKGKGHEKSQEPEDISDHDHFEELKLHSDSFLTEKINHYHDERPVINNNIKSDIKSEEMIQ